MISAILGAPALATSIINSASAINRSASSPGYPHQYFKVVEKARLVKIDSLPGIKPHGTAVALEGFRGWVFFDFRPQVQQAKCFTDFLYLRQKDFPAFLG
jgi:hypothetical protein